MAKRDIELTRKLCKKIIAKRTTIGEKSIPIEEMGIIRLIRYNTGSVILYKN